MSFAEGENWIFHPVSVHKGKTFRGVRGNILIKKQHFHQYQGILNFQANITKSSFLGTLINYGAGAHYQIRLAKVSFALG